MQQYKSERTVVMTPFLESSIVWGQALGCPEEGCPGVEQLQGVEYPEMLRPEPCLGIIEL